MKIYPSNHIVTEKQSLNHNDIPVSYVITNTNSYEIKINKIAAQFEEEKLIYPFDVVDTSCYYFNKHNSKIDDISIKLNENGKTIYSPTNYTEFIPDTFRVEAIIKRNVQYNNTDEYNIRIGCFDKSTADKLITIFGDAANRKICPSNISVNGKANNVYSLLNSGIEENDFVIVQTKDGKEIKVDDTAQYLDYDRALSVNTNLWIGTDSFNGLKEVVNDKDKISYICPKLYKNDEYEIKTDKDITYRFDPQKDIQDLPMTEYTYINLFRDEYPPILLLEKENSGFIIISHNSFLEEIEKNTKLFYEILMYVFLTRYETVKSKELWITDYSIDCIRNKETSFLRNHEEVNLTKLIENKHCPIRDQYQLIAIDADNSNVIFTDIDSKKNLYFSKINKTDPEKKTSDKTMYSSNGTVIQYEDEVIKLIENKININVVNEQYLKIDNGLSSEYRLSKSQSTTIKIPDLTQIYYLVLVKNENDSYFRLINKKDYDYDFVKIAEIKTVLYNNIENIDIRKYGGGLPQNIIEIEDDYNLQDISNLQGRPYRDTYTSIIKLPKRLEQYDNIIQSELFKHRAVADNLIVLYE